MTGPTKSVNELTELLLDAIFAETFLNRANLQPTIRALLHTFVVQVNNAPKNYNTHPSPNKHASRLRTIESREAEKKFWKDKVMAGLNDDEKALLYAESDTYLKEKGFR